VKVITVKIPAPLEKKLRQAAMRRGENFSELARRALRKEVEASGPDFATLAAPYRGMFRGPRDLSSREGYGR
jgi:predicted transcriptional regulator